MINNHYNNSNVSKIEEYLLELLRPAVSENVFVGTAPATLKSEWEDMVIIDCGLPIHDYGPYAFGNVYIYLLARPTSAGEKNGYQFNRMEMALNQVLDNAHDARYSIVRDSTGADYDSTTTWHRNYVKLDVTINNF